MLTKLSPFVLPLQSGSQNDLCDTWTPEEEAAAAAAQGRLTPASGGGGAEQRGRQRAPQRPQQRHGGGGSGNYGLAAEYPFQMNLCMQPNAGINFDLTHKRGKDNISSFFNSDVCCAREESIDLARDVCCGDEKRVTSDCLR